MGGGKPLLTVQALRAIAAASVVMLHVLAVTVQRAGYSFTYPYFCAAGVDLFFLIIAPQLFLSLRLDWHNVLFSYLFLLSRTLAGDVNTVVVTGWSLCYEV